MSTATVSGQNDLRVKVAELCGWTIPDHCITKRKGRGETKLDGACPDWGYHPTIAGDFPDYLNDLNACAEFENALTPEQVFFYDLRLRDIVSEDTLIRNINHPSQYEWHASAKQRCRAFIATMEGTK